MVQSNVDVYGFLFDLKETAGEELSIHQQCHRSTLVFEYPTQYRKLL